MQNSRQYIAAIVVMLFAGTAGAQDGRRYFTDRADEDWSFLKDAPRLDFWDPLKYIPFGREGWFVTLSGEARFRPEGFRIRRSRTRQSTIDNYALQRYLFGADVHVGAQARLFAELQSGVINGSLRSPRPTDRNTLDVHQGFFEWRQSELPNRGLSVKVGRQELAIGSSRLISASPGLNVKRSFDGVAGVYRASSWTLAGAAAHLVSLEGGAFDDGPEAGRRFWGLAASRRTQRFLAGELSTYYLGADSARSMYSQGIAPEVRHTVGVKWTGTTTRIALNYDAIFQWGRFGDAPIRAWAFATETGYQVAATGWHPRISVRIDSASGDRDASTPQLEAFNPLFPGNSYSGAVGLLGPTNLTDLTLALTMRPRPTLIVGVETPSYWRTATSDGIYATDLRLLIPHAAGDGRYVGTNPGVLVIWNATRHWQVQGVITRFLAGAFLENTFVAPGFGFYSGSLIYRF